VTKRNPWESFSDKHHFGELITSKISQIADYGIFVTLENGINGIVRLSDIDWVVPGEKAISRYHVGEPIEVMILSMQPELECISLGIKQLGPDPRSGPTGEPPSNAPVKPNGPKPPQPLSEVAES
jgi:small subunit ribosomal protein S1